MDINNEIPKEIKKINKMLMKEGFESIAIGDEALKHCHLTSKDALLLAHWQELSGLKFILNASLITAHRGSLYDSAFALATAAADSNLPDFVVQHDETSNIKNDVKRKFDLIAHTIRWFEFNKETAEKTKEKRRRFIDNVLLSIQIKDFISELAQIKPQNISPYQLYHMAIANFWSKKNQHAMDPFLLGYAIRQNVFFKPWLIISNVGTKSYDFIYGRNQQQLIKYLLHSDFLKNHSLEYHFNFELSLGWDKVLQKQLDFNQQIPVSLVSSLKAYQEMSEIKFKKHKLSHYFISIKNAVSDVDKLNRST